MFCSVVLRVAKREKKSLPADFDHVNERVDQLQVWGKLVISLVKIHTTSLQVKGFALIQLMFFNF